MSGDTSDTRPWRDPLRLKRLYHDEELTIAQVAERFGCADSTVIDWMDIYGIERRSGANRKKDASTPWRDEGLMRRLYLDELLSTTDIANKFDCAPSTITAWLDRHDIPTRSIAEGRAIKGRYHKCASFSLGTKGYERLRSDDTEVLVHRLVAVAEYGFDAVADMQVHHINENTWDNRPDNLELMTLREHLSHHHRKLTWLDKIRITELYRAGQSSYDLAPRFDVTSGTILEAVREVKPDAVR